jgi:hypothetical protein
VPHAPVSLIVGLLSASAELFDRAEALLAERFGKIARASAVMPFDYTHYYEPEMGPNLLRKFLAFERLVDAADLAEIKLWTNALEERFGQFDHAPALRSSATSAGEEEHGRPEPFDLAHGPELVEGQRRMGGAGAGLPAPRPINLDPGCIALSKLVLATTKDQAHRIYLGRGIYAEITLTYLNGAFRPMPWTYPDYRTEPYRRFFEQVRADLLEGQRGATADERR